MKNILIALGALLGLLFLAGIAIVSLVDVNAHKPRIEAAVSDARQMNLADVGAFLLAGPLGTAATKGYRFGGVSGAVAQGGESKIIRLVSVWAVNDGVAEGANNFLNQDDHPYHLKEGHLLIMLRFPQLLWTVCGFPCGNSGRFLSRWTFHQTA